jgi:hypothetical protein
MLTNIEDGAITTSITNGVEPTGGTSTIPDGSGTIIPNGPKAILGGATRTGIGMTTITGTIAIGGTIAIVVGLRDIILTGNHGMTTAINTDAGSAKSRCAHYRPT